jgi:hypothetical protein
MGLSETPLSEVPLSETPQSCPIISHLNRLTSSTSGNGYPARRPRTAPRRHARVSPPAPNHRSPHSPPPRRRTGLDSAVLQGPCHRRSLCGAIFRHIDIAQMKLPSTSAKQRGHRGGERQPPSATVSALAGTRAIARQTQSARIITVMRPFFAPPKFSTTLID